MAGHAVSDAVTHRGLFIVLEGGEGVGKTTQWQRLSAWIVAQGHEVVALREPGGTPVGDAIRALLLDGTTDVAASTEALLFAASRAQLVHTVIGPALERNAVVLVDRFLLSTYAYQGAGRGLPLARLREANQLATGSITPDVTLLLTMPLAESQARLDARGVRDRLEAAGMDFHRRVDAAFAEATAPAWRARHPEIGPVYAILASGPPDEVTARCVAQLTACCPTRFTGAHDG